PDRLVTNQEGRGSEPVMVVASGLSLVALYIDCPQSQGRPAAPITAGRSISTPGRAAGTTCDIIFNSVAPYGARRRGCHESLARSPVVLGFCRGGCGSCCRTKRGARDPA